MIAEFCRFEMPPHYWTSWDESALEAPRPCSHKRLITGRIINRSAFPLSGLGVISLLTSSE